MICGHQKCMHRPHHPLKAAPGECSLEAVYADHEVQDCTHRSNANLWKRSFEAVRVDKELFHCPHDLEAAPRECSLEAVFGNLEVCDCAHRSHSNLWQHSFEA
eukprot:3486867-Amphidinium_carterae.1